MIFLRHIKIISCRQKQGGVAPKKYFGLKKVIIFFLEHDFFFEIAIFCLINSFMRFENLLIFQQLFTYKVFCMEKRLPNIFKTTNVTKLTKAILKRTCRVLQVTCKWKTRKQPVCFFKGCWPTFDIKLAYTFGYILGKVSKLHFLENQQKSLKTGQHSYQ